MCHDWQFEKHWPDPIPALPPSPGTGRTPVNVKMIRAGIGRLRKKKVGGIAEDEINKKREEKRNEQWEG